MGLVGCFVSPHPPIIVPEVGGGRAAQAAATVAGMRRLGDEARDLAPDVIVIMSPHAPIDASSMGVSVAATCEGSLAQFGAPQVHFSLPGHAALSESILEQAGILGVAASPVIGRGGVLELDHGCLVPLAFVVPGLAAPPRLVVLSFSFLGRDQHTAFGEAIGAAIDAFAGRVLYVASGDLSHRLTPGAPAGYTPRAADFDRRIVEAFAAADGAGLLQIPAGLQREAGECGYRSMVTLFGLLRGRSYDTEVFSYEGPWGVGYLVGSVHVPTEDAGTVGAGSGTIGAGS
jgi:aromatic ring-opening dioxygenase LigB subunit